MLVHRAFDLDLDHLARISTLEPKFGGEDMQANRHEGLMVPAAMCFNLECRGPGAVIETLYFMSCAQADDCDHIGWLCLIVVCSK